MANGSSTRNSTLQRLVNSFSRNGNVQKLMQEFQKLSEDIKSRNINMIDLKIDPKAKTAFKQARSRYQHLLKQFQTTQSRLKDELNDAATLLKKSAKEVRRDLEKFQKLANSKTSNIHLFNKDFGTKKKTTRKSATTSKSAASKKAKPASKAKSKTGSRTKATPKMKRPTAASKRGSK